MSSERVGRGWIGGWRPTPVHLLLLSIVAGAVAVVELAYTQAPVPPGGDSGHWITTSFAFIGRAHPTEFTVQAGLYPPVLFFLIGPIVLATGSPLTTGFIVGGVLLALYGLTTIHLARRYLRTGPGQLLFVGLAVLNGTTLQILFWGGYPNFLAFAVFNEAMVFLLAFLRTRGTTEGVAFWSLAGVLYLTHNLTFVVFAIAAGLGIAFLLLEEPRRWRWFTTRGSLGGIAIFVALAGAYQGITFALGVPHPGYLFTNPSTYVVDHIGLVFRPFFFAPAFFPRGPQLFFDPLPVVALLLGLSAILLGGVGWAVRRWPGRLPTPYLLIAGWLSAVFLVPSAGYLAHVDTDYPRFAYFLPFPVALGVVAALEWVAERSAPDEEAPPVGLPRRPRARPAIAWGSVILVLLAVFASVTVPSVGRSEGEYVSPTHDAAFVDAVGWMNHHARPGAVITDAADTQRWVEALTARDAYSSTSPWLHFYTDQIVSNERTYWALNSQYTATDGAAAIAFTGPNGTMLDSFPQYVGYLQGVPFPLIRLSPASFTVGYRDATGTANTTSAVWGAPRIGYDSATPTVWGEYRTSAFTWNETARLTGDGIAQIEIRVAPASGVNLTAVTLAMKAPIQSRFGATAGFQGIRFSGGTGFSAAVRGPDGSLPTPSTVTVTGQLSLAPNPGRSYVTTPANRSTLVLNFATAPGGFDLTLTLNSSGLSNPAVTLPPTFTTADFLDGFHVRLLLAQTTTPNYPTVALFEQGLGFTEAYNNSEWTVLQR